MAHDVGHLRVLRLKVLGVKLMEREKYDNTERGRYGRTHNSLKIVVVTKNI